MTYPLQVSGKREVFWDEYLIDTEKTTAAFSLHHLTEAGTVIHPDMEFF